jgi:signal transduction histidine kinase/GTP-sensing pleiotropic transcriptional regulator CodY
VERGLVFGSALIYLAIFPLLHEWVGDSATAFSALPVAVAGWYFGLWPGIIASLLAILINGIFLASYAGMGFTILAHQGFLPGFITLIIVGAVSGRVGQFLKERKNIENELRANERNLSLINDMTRAVLASEDFNATLQELARNMAKLLKADDCYVTGWNAERQASVRLTTTASLSQPYNATVYESDEPTMTSSVIKAGRVLTAENVLNSPYVNAKVAQQYPARSLLGVPLIYGEHKLGAVLIAHNQPHKFTSDEIRLAEQAGNLVALALWDVQQEIELARRLRESNVLTEIGRALSESERIGLDKVLQMIVESARDLIPGAEKTVIHLIDLEQEALIPRAVTGFSEFSGGQLNMRLGKGVAGQVFATGEVINIADVETDPRFLRDERPARFRSLMVSSIQSGQERLGTISVQSNEPDAFNTEEQKLLAGLGIQAAIAIENARLLENTQQSLKEVNALYQVARGLVASLDTNQLMDDVVKLLHESFGYYHAQVYVVDPETNDLVMQKGSGLIGERLEQNGHRLKAGVGIVGHAAETGEAFVTNNAQDTIFFFPNPLLPNTQSELAVPIKVGGHVLGVLDVQLEPPNRLTERDLQLVRTVADQLTVALQKASLYSDLQESLAQEKSIRSQLVQSERLALVGRLLASVSHELNNPLQAIQNALFLVKDDEGMSPQSRQDLQIVLSETERMAGLIERLRASYRPTQLDEFQPIQINTIVEDVYALLATHMRHKNVAFEFHPDPNLPPVSGLSDQLRQVTLNLLMNGVEAIPSGGLLTVSTQTAENKEVFLSVADTGPGIDPILLPRIFDAFVTSKERGTGLGLTITYDIVHRHNGRIEAENNPDGGATFKIWLPVHHVEKK